MNEQQLDIIIYVKDLRPGYCIDGTKAFLKRHDLSWDKFRKDGLLASDLEATGDAMAIHLVERTRARR